MKQSIKLIVLFICLTLVVYFIIFSKTKPKPKEKLDQTISSYRNKDINAIFENKGRNTLNQDQINSFIHVYNLSREVNGTFSCVNLQITPKAKVCLHPLEKDIYISTSIKQHGAWERDILNGVMNVLKKNPNMGLIDLGANIGQHTMAAAAMGRKVLAVEPINANVRLFVKAIQLNNFEDKVTLIKNAVSDMRGVANIMYLKDNQGGLPLVKGKVEKGAQFEQVDVIYMDDLADFVTFKQAVMKIDIEGQEEYAFVHFKKLFTKVHISHVFMEWSAGQRKNDLKKAKVIETMIEEFINFGFSPKDMNGHPLNSEVWDKWPNNIIWENVKTM